MANNIVIFGKINRKKLEKLFQVEISPQLERLIADGIVVADQTLRVKQDFVELHRGVIENDKLGRFISDTFCFCDEITITPNERPEEKHEPKGE